MKSPMPCSPASGLLREIGGEIGFACHPTILRPRICPELFTNENVSFVFSYLDAETDRNLVITRGFVEQFRDEKEHFVPRTRAAGLYVCNTGRVHESAFWCMRADACARAVKDLSDISRMLKSDGEHRL